MVEEGGFRYWLNTYSDMLFDDKANDQAYDSWRRQVLKRMTDPEKQKILAPERKPHPWGTKRPSLEQRYYEVVNEPHVEITDVNANPIEEVKAEGIVTPKGLREFDILVLATGFDSVTGSLAQLNIQDTEGRTIGEHWKNGTKTSMGIAIPGFPNMVSQLNRARLGVFLTLRISSSATAPKPQPPSPTDPAARSSKPSGSRRR